MTSNAFQRMRFFTERDQYGEKLTIPADQNLFVIVFFFIWLTAWTVAGLSWIVKLIATLDPSVLPLLIGWSLAWLMSGSFLAWMLTGRETLRLVGANLEVTREIMGYELQRLFAGQEIRQIATRVPFRFPGCVFFPSPIRLSGNSGSVHFSYRGRSYELAYGMNTVEAAAIADWLRERLPGARE